MKSDKTSATVAKIIALGSIYGYKVIDQQSNIKMISFWKEGGARINVYHSTMTVATCLKHPTKGRTQLFRRNVDLPTLEKIFINPRIHTDAGYYERVA